MKLGRWKQKIFPSPALHVHAYILHRDTYCKMRKRLLREVKPFVLPISGALMHVAVDGFHWNEQIPRFDEHFNSASENSHIAHYVKKLFRAQNSSI